MSRRIERLYNQDLISLRTAQKFNEIRMELATLNERLNREKEKCQMYQRLIMNEKDNYRFYDPYDGLSRSEHEKRCADNISDYRYAIKIVQGEISELRKALKEKNRELDLMNREFDLIPLA